EDGHLQGNAIAQGAVDSTIAHHVPVPAEGERAIYMILIAGHSREELIEQHKWLLKTGPQGVIDRTTGYWRLWVGGTNINFGNLPPRSLTCSSARCWSCARRSTTAGPSSRQTTPTSCSSRATRTPTCGRAMGR